MDFILIWDITFDLVSYETLHSILFHTIGSLTISSYLRTIKVALFLRLKISKCFFSNIPRNTYSSTRLLQLWLNSVIWVINLWGIWKETFGALNQMKHKSMKFQRRVLSSIYYVCVEIFNIYFVMRYDESSKITRLVFFGQNGVIHMAV